MGQKLVLTAELILSTATWQEWWSMLENNNSSSPFDSELPLIAI